MPRCCPQCLVYDGCEKRNDCCSYCDYYSNGECPLCEEFDSMRSRDISSEISEAPRTQQIPRFILLEG